MEAVLISIRPQWCKLIASGKKTIEIRKTRPRKTPFKAYIYETRGFEKAGNDNLNCTVGGNGRGMVIGEFVCDRVFDIEFDDDEGYSESYIPLGFSDCLNDEQFDGYLRAKKGYGWHITNLVIYDQPKRVTDFKRPCKNAFYCESCAMYQNKNSVCGNAALQISRPPQSWMYVKEAWA